MKVFLLHEDRDFAVKPGLRDAIFDAMASGDLFALTSARRDLQRVRSSGPVAAAPGNDDVLTQDLELQTLWNTMAAGDEFLFEMAKRGVLSSLSDPDAVVYRQRVLADCLEQPETVRQLYELAIDALENERKVRPLWHMVVARQHRLPVGAGADAAGRYPQAAPADRGAASRELPF